LIRGDRLTVQRTSIEELPPELIEPLKTANEIVVSYLSAMNFIIQDTRRDPAYLDNHLLSYLAQDFLQSAISIVTLSMEGLISVAKRELRFIIETSIKLCFVQQKDYASTIQKKLDRFDKELSSQRISIKQNLDLSMLPDSLKEPFEEEVGRVYGLTSNYVHLTPVQIQERIAAVDAGRTAGRESAADVEALNALLSRGLAISLTLLFHSVPSYVAGDWMVENDGSTIAWHFAGSRFLAGIDGHFDYKAERQDRLVEIQEMRRRSIRF
jgi:hypothetical protein